MELNLKISVFAIALLLLSGCSSTLDPKDFEVKPHSVPVANFKPVTIKARLTGAKEHELPLPGGTVSVNEDEFTQALVNRVADTLRSNTAAVADTAGRSLEIQVVKVSLQPDRTVYCVIDFNRKLGDDEFYGFQSRAKNWNFKTACEEALNNATDDLLRDQNTIRYLKGE